MCAPHVYHRRTAPPIGSHCLVDVLNSRLYNGPCQDGTLTKPAQRPRPHDARGNNNWYQNNNLGQKKGDPKVSRKDSELLFVTLNLILRDHFHSLTYLYLSAGRGIANINLQMHMQAAFVG